MEKKKIKKVIKNFFIIVIGIPILIFFLLFLVVGGMIFYDKLVNVPPEPEITYGEFPFELVYEYNGVEYSIKDTIICNYEGIKYSLDGGNGRTWSGEYKENKQNGFYYIDEENNPNLYIHIPTNERYYMDDFEKRLEPNPPYIEVEFVPMAERTEKDYVENFDIRIVEWKPSQPIQNTFK